MNSQLKKKLIEYSRSEYYPFHMPGHKRQICSYCKDMPNPYSIDITEIAGFDNLHHPEGILKQSMEEAANIYHADKTYYLVNGSSCGILSAICGITKPGGTIVMSRNCHKAAYHGVFLNQLKIKYIYPQIVPEYGIQGGLIPENLEKLLKTSSDIQAVFIVSPTYDGIVSDVKRIAEMVHQYDIPLIVDEAHGAHFSFGGGKFPISALELGADAVIQSVHKTLPSMTQTALLHIKSNRIDFAKIERYLQIFQSSSPSYLLMTSIEECISYMDGPGRLRMQDYAVNLKKTRKCLKKLAHLKLLDSDIIGKYGVYNIDLSKIVISTRESDMNGEELCQLLRDKYQLEMEMNGADYMVALSSLCDSDIGLKRLSDALIEIDQNIPDQSKKNNELKKNIICENWKPEIRMSIAEALNAECHEVGLKESKGMISAEFVYLYPPGIPFIAPGEIIQGPILEMIDHYLRIGLQVQGLKDSSVRKIQIVS